MKTLRKYATTISAIVVAVLLSVFVGGYILAKQRLRLPQWVPVLGTDYVSYKATLPTAQSLTPGQGQTVNVAGVPVGEISKVDLVDGRAVVTMSIKKRYTPIYHDATVLVRPKTGLNDMLLELSPGSKRTGVLPRSEPIPVSQTLSNVNLDEILASLDGDTRTYLQLLLGAGGEGLGSNGKALSATLKRFEPTASGLRQVTEQLQERRDNIKRAVTNFRAVSEALGGKDKQLAELVDSSNAVFQSFADQDTRLREAIRELPSTLDLTNQALQSTGTLATQLRPAATRLQPAARALASSLPDVRTLFRQTEPAIRTQLRPFSRDVLPVVRQLRPAARDLAALTPDLGRSLDVLNTTFNQLAYDKPGDGSDSFLFWLGWFNHVNNSIFSAQDAAGPMRRAMVQLSCSQLGVLENIRQVNPQLGTLVTLLDAPQQADVCPEDTSPEPVGGVQSADAATTPVMSDTAAGAGSASAAKEGNG